MNRKAFGSPETEHETDERWTLTQAQVRVQVRISSHESAAALVAATGCRSRLWTMIDVWLEAIDENHTEHLG